MTTQDPTDRADDELRALLAQNDPLSAAVSVAPTHLLDRVLEDARVGDGQGPDQLHPHAEQQRASWWSRHWQGGLMAAAVIATIALATPSALPGLFGGSSDAGVEAADVAVSDSGVDKESAGAPAETTGATDAASGEDGTAGTGTTSAQNVPTQRLIRSASMLVGTEDITGERDEFVQTITALDGRVMSESVITQGYDGDGVTSSTGAADIAISPDQVGVSYPYPWYPQGPGVWLSVEVPAESYDEAVDAARSAGEVIQLQQSSYDVGTQIADVNARIRALETSLATLTALMEDATSVSDVVALEAAISARQSELDALKAQQRDLANQTAMSQVSLTLMSPDDARDSVDPQPNLSWWESFLQGLGDFWAWLGRALLIISPLLLAMGIIWAVRRKRGTGTGTPSNPPAGE